MSFLPEMFVPVLVLVVASTQRPNPTEARRGHGDLLASAARSRADRTRWLEKKTGGEVPMDEA
jgi:hypothetical protein